MIKSITKGKSFERQVANWLTKITGVKWLRIPQSGATSTNNKLENWHGDVFSESPLYCDIVIEAKSYKERVVLEDILNPKSHLNEWIAQTKKEAGNRFWILFFKANFGSTFLLVPSVDDIGYQSESGLKLIYSACQEVCGTDEWTILQVK